MLLCKEFKSVAGASASSQFNDWSRVFDRVITDLFTHSNGYGEIVTLVVFYEAESEDFTW